LPHTPSSHVLLMPNSKHLTHGISNLVSLITKTKLGLSDPYQTFMKKLFLESVSSSIMPATKS
jgi:hypothetical protein